MTEYRLFPDMRLFYGSDSLTEDSGTEICCCTSGICEYNIRGEYYYLTEGKCLITERCEGQCQVVHSPDFCCISLLLDSGSDSAGVSGILDVSGILSSTQRKDTHIFSADSRMKSLFSDITEEARRSRTSALKIKVLEFLVLLGEQSYPEISHRSILKKAGSFICQSAFTHYTIAELSELFGINPTTLKKGFSEYYSCSVYSYAKKNKMFRAAKLLRDTDMKIIDIAEEVGYSNASKFSYAFRSVMGAAPKRFRMEHNKGIRQQERRNIRTSSY